MTNGGREEEGRGEKAVGGNTVIYYCSLGTAQCQEAEGLGWHRLSGANETVLFG